MASTGSNRGITCEKSASVATRSGDSAYPRRSNRRRLASAAALALWIGIASPHCGVSQHPEPPADDLFVEAVLPPDDALGVAAGQEPLTPRGTVSALVVFAQFRGEAGGDISLPSWAGDLLDRERAGSLAHFYDTMSFGQLQVRGELLPRRYTSKQPASAYLADRDDQFGRYREFVREILDGVDAEVDLGQFDNDGPDGLPNSGDDDGVVDYVFIMVRSTPARFIYGGANGIAGLGGRRRVGYNSADASANGKRIYISGASFHGSIVRERGFVRTVGVMAHEFGHAFSLPDLYDMDRETPAEDSGGIGRWGLMGRGAVGWATGAASASRGCTSSPYLVRRRKAHPPTQEPVGSTAGTAVSASRQYSTIETVGTRVLLWAVLTPGEEGNAPRSNGRGSPCGALPPRLGHPPRGRPGERSVHGQSLARTSHGGQGDAYPPARRRGAGRGRPSATRGRGTLLRWSVRQAHA